MLAWIPCFRLGIFRSRTGTDGKGIIMRKLAVVMALASTALAGPAFAKDKAWYVGAEGGAMLVEDSNYDLNAVPNAVKVNQKTGFDVDGVVGYDFGMLRVEGEVGYKQSEVSKFSTITQIPQTGVGSASWSTVCLISATTPGSAVMSAVVPVSLV